jgi:hypothetical protein
MGQAVGGSFCLPLVTAAASPLRLSPPPTSRRNAVLGHFVGNASAINTVFFVGAVTQVGGAKPPALGSLI